MKKFSVLVLTVLLFASCRYKSGSGNIVTEKRNTSSFTGISVGGGFEVELRHGDVTAVSVEADDNLIKYIKTDVSDGQLKIKMDDINVHDAHLKVYITAPAINNIKASAAANVDVKDQLKSNGTIELKSSSGAEIKTMLEAPEVIINASSGGNIELSGRTKNVKAEVSSGSTINAKELQSENADVTASSGASATIHASVSIVAHASSGASIHYHGGAANVQKSQSSGGEVESDN